MRLPIELYRNIVEQTDLGADLLPLLHVCSAMRAEAERKLYRVVAFDPGVTPPSHWAQLRSRWIESVGGIGHLIHQLYLGDLTPAEAKFLLPVYQGLINLKVLRLATIYDASYIPPPSAPFKLLSLNLPSLGDITALGDMLISFLESQPMIEELTFFCNLRKPLPPSILPNLSTLTTLPSFAWSILPGRHITYLRLASVGGSKPTAKIEGIQTIRGLCVYGLRIFDLLEEAFPTLEFLQVYLVGCRFN
jgi:hypothetical protein